LSSLESISQFDSDRIEFPALNYRVIIVLYCDNCFFKSVMKEEGEITDDDDEDDKHGGSETPIDKDGGSETVAMSETEIARSLLRKRRARNYRGIHSATTRSRDRSASRSRDPSAAVSASRESSPLPAKKAKLNPKAHIDSRTAVASSSKRCSPCPSTLSLNHRAEHLHPSQSRVTQSISGDSEFPKSGSQDRFTGSQDSQSSSSYNVGDGSDAEVITIDDSDGEIVENATNLDEDLDELQLRREALDSAVKYNRSRKSSGALFDGNLVDSLKPETQLVSKPTHLPSSMPDLSCPCASGQTSIEDNLHASNSSAVSGVISPLTAGGCDQLASDTSHLSPDHTALLNQQHHAVPSHSSSVTDPTYRNNSVAVSSPASPLHQHMRLSDVDNYDEVDMDLDSGNSSDSPTDTAEQNDSQHQVMRLLKSSDDTVSQSAIPCPAVDDRSNAVAKYVSGVDVPAEKMPDLVSSQTRMVDSCNNSIDNLQPQRKVEDAEKKSELLLREAVLRSLSSKRQQQQQQQSQLETLVPQDRTKASNTQVAAHSIKRTITVAPSGPLPVHQPVVISLTGESSDSNDELEVGDLSDKESRTAASSSISSNLERVLREIRRATEAPKPEDCDTASDIHAETMSAVKYQEKPSTSSSETTSVANEHMLPNKASHTFPPFPPPSVKTPLTSCNRETEDSTQLNIYDSSLRQTAVSRLEREISCERRKLQQQKIAVSKTKLKMARKREQVSAAEKRVKKLREQLVAAEKILASSKKQLHNLHEETLSLMCGIEQQQKAVDRLEVDLCTAQKDLVPPNNECVHDSENFLPKEIFSINSKQLFSSVTATNVGDSVADSCLSTTVRSHSRLGAGLSDIKQTQTHRHSSARITTKVQTSNRPRKFWYFSAMGACKAESDKDKLLKSEFKSEASAELEDPASHTDTSVLPAGSGKRSVNQRLNLDMHPVTEPCISVSKSDTLTHQQVTDGTSVVVSDDVVSVHISPASLDELMTLSDSKIKQISHHYNASLNKNLSLCSPTASSHLFSSDPVFCFHFPVLAATFPAQASSLAAGSEANASEIGNSFMPYLSALLCFRSYRFCEFYQQTGLTASAKTFSHKLDCHVPLCQFDLMGKCLDENCPWQHRSDYHLSNRECLLDLLSYHPSAVRIDSSTPLSQYEQLLSQYVDVFLKGAGHSQLSHSEQCSRLIDCVKRDAGLTSPHAVCTSERAWKLSRSKPRSDAAGVSNDLLCRLDGIPEISHDSAANDDVRYWMVAETEQIKSLEKAVGDTPTDDSLWIKLAYAKMTEMRCCTSHDEYISYGLNVLTHAVEANPSNSNLWRHYLDLYMERSHAEKDISSLFEQAIQYAPSYEFFWKYLQLPVGYSQKMDICKRLRQYLCSPMCPDGAQLRSHHLLETVLYQAALCTTSGRFKNALQVLQAIVQSKPSVIWLTLTPCDRVVMWLSFIYLYECRQLPEALFDPANSNPGPIVRKEAFVVPFQIGTKTRISYETLLQLFQSAFNACDKDMKPSGTVSHDDDYLLWLSALHRSRILLELSCHGLPQAIQLTEQCLQQRPYLVSVWLFLVQLIVASTTVRQTVSSRVAQTVEQAVSQNPHSITLFLAGVSALIECGDTDGALSFAERCPISLYEVDELDSSSVDPNLLYCCLLGQPVPPSYKVPVLRPSVSRQFVSSEQANLWLCYCLLLDLQGAHDQATEAYRLSLSCLTRAMDISRLWLAFLRRSVAVISHQLPWLSPGASSVDRTRRLCQQFEVDVDQALVSLPVRRTLPHSTQTWDDYTAHNDVIQVRVSCLARADDVEGVYEKYLRLMPANAELALKTIDWLLSRRDVVKLCLGLSLVALHSCPRSAGLWNTALRLSRRQSVHAGLVRAVYAKAVKMLPYSASLWRNRIMFEVVSRSPRALMQQLADRCQHLQVNVAGFVDNLLK